MIFTLRLLGFEVLHIELAQPADTEDESASLDGGTTAAYPVGFTLPASPPYEFEPPPHVEWGE